MFGCFSGWDRRRVSSPEAVSDTRTTSALGCFRPYSLTKYAQKFYNRIDKVVETL